MYIPFLFIFYISLVIIYINVMNDFQHIYMQKYYGN